MPWRRIRHHFPRSVSSECCNLTFRWRHREMQMLNSCKGSAVTLVLLCVSKIKDCFWKVAARSPRRGEKILQCCYNLIINEDIFSYALHSQDTLLTFGKEKKKHLNRRTDTPLWLVIHSNALAEYSLKFEQVKSTWSTGHRCSPSLLFETIARFSQCGENLVESSCSQPWLFLKLAVKNHLLQTQLPHAVPSPGTTSFKHSFLVLYPLLEAMLLTTLSCLYVPTVFSGTRLLSPRGCQGSHRQRTCCVQLFRNTRWGFTCALLEAAMQTGLSHDCLVSQGNNILSSSRYYGNRLAARIQLHFTNAQQKLVVKKCCVLGLLS